MKPVSRSIREAVQNLIRDGKSTRKIASQLNISQSTVQRIRNKCKVSVKVNKGGRPKKMSPQDSRRVIRYLASGEASSASNAAALLRRDTGKKISKWTVQRALHDAKFVAIEKKKKPLLSKKNIKARLDFVKKYEKWTEDDWMRVIWSDETKINRYTTDGRQWSWKRKGESMQVKDFILTVKHGGGNIKLWGCITAYGVGSLHKIDGIMNQLMYKNILSAHLIDVVENMPYPINEVIFQHDNDPKHTAKSVKMWLDTHEFQVLQWPAQSPDLNPIENLWAYLKSHLVNEYDSPPSSVNVLWERVQEQWDKISPDFCEKLVRSMPKRLRAVKKAKGRWTKY